MTNIKIYPIFLLFLFILPFKLYSQKSNAKIDSLIHLIDGRYIKGNVDNQDILKYTTDLYYLSKEAGYAQGQIYSIIEASRSHYANGDFTAVLKKIDEGIDLAQSKHDYNSLTKILLLHYGVLLITDDINAAKRTLAKAEYYNNLIRLSSDKKLNEIYILLAKAELLVDNNGLYKDMNTVISYKKKAYDNALKIKDSNKYKKYTVLYALESLAWSTALSKNLTMARAYTSEIDKLLLSYPNNNLIIENFITKGAIENIAGNYSAAIEQFSQVISRAKQKNNYYYIYAISPMVSVAYEGLKDKDNALLYSWKYNHLLDSITVVKEKNRDLIGQINNKIVHKEDTLFNQTNIVLFIILVLISVFVFLYSKNKSSRTQKLLKQTENTNIDEILTFKDEEQQQVLNTKSEITKELMLLAKEDINIFYIEFKKAYPTFCQSLNERFPELNISDINFCTLIKMNFGIKEISQYTNVSIRSVESRRYRVIKKMQLKTQSDLYFVLSTL